MALCRRAASRLTASTALTLRGEHTASKPQLAVGDKASDTRRVTRTDLRVFGALCGDDNPVHSSGVPAGDGRRVLVHGAFLNSLVSGVIGSKLPGPGAIVVGQNLRFPRPCLVDEEVTIEVEVKEVRKIVEVTFRCVVNSDSESKVVMEGNAKLIVAALASDLD
jgi:acyl dehydratase